MPSKPSYDLLFVGGEVLLGEDRLEQTTLAIKDGKIAGLGVPQDSPAAETISLKGLTVLPGVLDTQVHFREPGFPDKETLEDGTRAAALGGIVGVFEMPNTQPATTTVEALAGKFARAKGRCYTDYAFYVGAAPENLTSLETLEKTRGTSGVKLFMGSSTGSLLVSDDAGVEKTFLHSRRRVAVHSEDEMRLKERRALVEHEGATALEHPVWRDAETARLATERLLRIVKTLRRKVHILHISTGDELPLIAEAKSSHGELISAEVTPQHLTLSAPECYEAFGAFAQMNPPIRDKSHSEALWRGVSEGVLDVIGSDHAPHTKAEKTQNYPHTPSGMPGVQTLLPLMLNHVAEGKLSLWRLAEMTAINPARLFGICGLGALTRPERRADLTIIDRKRQATIDKDWLAYRCGWSPFEGRKVTGWPVMSFLRGKALLRDGAIESPPFGVPLDFEEAPEELSAVAKAVLSH